MLPFSRWVFFKNDWIFFAVSWNCCTFFIYFLIFTTLSLNFSSIFHCIFNQFYSLFFNYRTFYRLNFLMIFLCDPFKISCNFFLLNYPTLFSYKFHRYFFFFISCHFSIESYQQIFLRFRAIFKIFRHLSSHLPFNYFRFQIVKYTADEGGYNANVVYEGQARYPVTVAKSGGGGGGGGAIIAGGSSGGSTIIASAPSGGSGGYRY